ncbi:MAG: S9 family peptidase [Candidatus Aminicenantes bacterium]|jgi:dipeptidyl-peptidase-4
MKVEMYVNLKRLIRMLLMFGLFLGSFIVSSDTGDPSLLTLERIFTNEEFSAEKLPPARWWRQGKGYTIVEESKEIKDARDLVLYRTKSGKRTVLVSARDLLPPGREKPLEIEDYTWSPDKKKLLVFTNTKRVWRRNTRGDYWVLNLEPRKLKKIGSDKDESMLMFAKFSPDNSKVGYVYRHNIYIEDLASGKVTQITNDGSDTIINGTGDWVYEEEFGIRDGFRWSPDSKRIAFWQFDSSKVGQFHLINNTDSLYPTITTVPYPKAGTTNSSVRLGVVSAQGGPPVWMKPDGDPRNYYIAYLEWAENSREIIFQRLNRRQNTNWLTRGNVVTGDTTVILQDKDDAWLEVVEDLLWLEDGRSFTWVSERDGWRHLYRVSRQGGEMNLITPVDFDLIRIEHIDKKGRWIYFIASPGNPAQRYLFRMPPGDSSKVQRLTPAHQPGTHSYDISPDGKWAFHTYSGFGKPARVELIRLPGHRPVRILVGNDDLRKKLRVLKQSPVKFFRVDISDGIILEGWLMKPYNFDPNKKYPLLFYIYGEPAGQTVLDRWGRSNYLWHLMLTQQGYLVASIDPRGTPAPRGREWRKAVYKQVGILASQDHAAAVRKIVNDWKFVDPDRIGVWGWSGGGTMSLNLILRYPELYITAMAIALVSDQRFYDTIYQERYMSLPEDNPEGFKKGSPINFVERLKGNLLIVHGTADDNVHYQSFEALVNELIRHNKMFTMMSYPNRSHSIREGENTRRHLFEVLTRYLHHHMPPGATQ